ncbi:hypothetical protein CTEN210_17568 [Chaetoceros tenuissimus]|uniref:RNA helicase n=1 Tax=Chaetoceros tenuissimus TaxID=426638 RepID=A0AAD3DAS6_9STRA|nr:hypothetical protein CTEN210_17568 [Chaetoceros tenuissimus]
MSKEEPLIDPNLLIGLSEEEKQEALAAAAAAKRAEERAEQRALAKAMERKRQERLMEQQREQQEKEQRIKEKGFGSSSDGGKVVFLSKRKRQELKANPTSDDSIDVKRSNGSTNGESRAINNTSRQTNSRQYATGQKQLSSAELISIKKAYLGETALDDEQATSRKQMEDRKRARQKKKITFKFKWDDDEDTSTNEPFDAIPLMKLGDKKKRKARDLLDDDRDKRGNGRNIDIMAKPIDTMTSRDWRILRENYDIVVRGGKAPPPLRSFREASSKEVPAIHPVLIDAIENVMRYKEPSAIQRQAIPIGLQRRDLIGLAETGSGKTAAFGIPLIQLILCLPGNILSTVNENGPLALVMAPTRELAQQIHVELNRLLSRQKSVKTACIVGGQNIQTQAMELRNGVHIVVGTPGRLNDCLESAYLVLNQCSYIVLDEADRMIDLGFAPQIESILDSMGCLLKSDNEKEAYEQEVQDLKGITTQVPTHRLTAMFSATMPTEVQRIAKKYLRHPSIVKIGGDSGGKNKRIHQTVLFLSSPNMKEKAMRGVIVNRTRVNDKVIVFVNEKKNTESVARMIERMGRRTVILHGGKTQEQREENLEAFRRGGVILVATDVAGRGLDIPNVKHIINYDVPSRSIDSYCHRIGRTGRAGQSGEATSFITDEDEGIMAALKSYLESVGAKVPDRLARHPAASSGVGSSIIY